MLRVLLTILSQKGDDHMSIAVSKAIAALAVVAGILIVWGIWSKR